MKTIFTAGAKTREGWEFLLTVYTHSASEAEKSKMLEALASTDDVRKLIWYERAKRLYYAQTKEVRICASMDCPCLALRTFKIIGGGFHTSTMFEHHKTS